MGEELAVIEGTPGQVGSAVRTAALYAEGNDPHEEMFIQVDSAGIETPASGSDATQTSYCSIHADRFHGLTVAEPVKALFPVLELLEWLAWFEEGTTLRIGLVGDPGAEVISEFVIEGTDRTVRLDCIDEPALLSEVEIWLPGRFKDGKFLDEDNDPLPTQIETTISQLRVLVDAVSQCEDVDAYPLTAIDGQLRFEVDGESAHVEAQLDGTVQGPDVRNRYGAGFARIVRGIDGEIRLQTSPGGDLVFVSERDHSTLRYYVAHQEA